MLKSYFDISKDRKVFLQPRPFGHIEYGFAQNGGMKKIDIGQVFRRNLEQAMERAGINQQHLAPKAGMSIGHLSEVRRGLSSPTIGLVNDLAHALGIAAWELMADGHAVRQDALEKMLWRQSTPQEEDLPLTSPPPSEKRAPKQPALRRRRPPGKKADAPDRHEGH